MAPVAVTLSDFLMSLLLFETYRIPNSSGGDIAHIGCDVLTRELESALACNFNCLIETDGLFKVISSHQSCTV